MFERGLSFEVGSAGQATADVSDRQIMSFHLFDLPAVRLALVDRMAETSPCLALVARHSDFDSLSMSG
jgi:hypothetical protein